MKKKTQRRIAGALFDFLGHLTTMDKSLTVGASHSTPAVLEVLEEWAEKRQFPLEDADVKGWQGVWAHFDEGLAEIDG